MFINMFVDRFLDMFIDPLQAIRSKVHSTTYTIICRE